MAFNPFFGEDIVDAIVAIEGFAALILPNWSVIPKPGISVNAPSQSELDFQWMFQKCFPQYLLVREVLLSDISTIDRSLVAAAIEKKAGGTKIDLQRYGNRAIGILQQIIGRKQCDFLVFDPVTQKLLGVVEVDGATHNSKEQIGYDYIKNLFFGHHRVQVLRLSNAQVAIAKRMYAQGDKLALNQILRVAKSNWELFVKHPSKSNMQLHHPA